jgi:hypothetical protein
VEVLAPKHVKVWSTVNVTRIALMGVIVRTTCTGILKQIDVFLEVNVLVIATVSHIHMVAQGWEDVKNAPAWVEYSNVLKSHAMPLAQHMETPTSELLMA